MPPLNEVMLQKYQNALLNAGIGLWELDLESKILKWDEGYGELYEIDKGIQQYTQAEWINVIYPEDRDMIFNHIQEALLGKNEINAVFRILTQKTRKIKYIKTCAYKVTKGGGIVALVGLNWDITNESLLQMDLLKEKKFSENILNAIPDPIFVKNEKHEVIYANTEYEKFVGMPKERFLGKDDYDFFPEEVADFFWDKNEEVFTSNHPTENEEKVSDSRGRPRDVLTKKTPLIAANNEKILVGVIRDITELKNMQNSLIEQSKMASLGEMAAEIAHEINNPLMIAQGKTQLLIDKLTKPNMDMAAFKKDLEAIETNCMRIDKIIKSLKSVSRKADRDPYEEVSVLKLIDEAFEISKERFRKKKLNLFVITDEFIDYTYTTRARPSEIVQVLVNLLNNAYDAIESQPRGWARISLTVPKNHFQIEVTDSGNEIEPEVAQRMMEPFFTTKMTGKGTGLGLSVSKQIIHSHKGDLFYDPTSANTRFVFTLPKL